MPFPSHEHGTSKWRMEEEEERGKRKQERSHDGVYKVFKFSVRAPDIMQVCSVYSG
jgi:hypothetical protein